MQFYLMRGFPKNVSLQPTSMKYFSDSGVIVLFMDSERQHNLLWQTDKRVIYQPTSAVDRVDQGAKCDPRRFPERALERRNLVLQLSASLGVISEQQKVMASSAALSVPKQPADRIGRFPGYVAIVRRELVQDYTSEQLTADGLSVYTAFDPQIHRGLDQGRKKRTHQIKSHRP